MEQENITIPGLVTGPACADSARTLEVSPEAVLPRVPHRQWTLSLPRALRLAVVKRLEVRLVQAVWRWQRAFARRLGVEDELRGGGLLAVREHRARPARRSPTPSITASRIRGSLHDPEAFSGPAPHLDRLTVALGLMRGVDAQVSSPTAFTSILRSGTSGDLCQLASGPDHRAVALRVVSRRARGYGRGS